MTEVETVRVLGISGSLRKGSLNTMALVEARRLAPPGMTVEIHDWRDIPVYDDDLWKQGLPAPVEALREAIRGADALLFATPEYNSSVPGALKNAIDWASRPPSQPFAGKPTAIMGATPGVLGTVKGQIHLRQALQSLDATLMSKPEVFIGGANKKFDADGRLTDEPTAEAVTKLMVALRDWTLVLRRGRQTSGAQAPLV